MLLSFIQQQQLPILPACASGLPIRLCGFCCKPKGGVLLATKPDVSPPLPRLPLSISGAISLEDLPVLSHVVDPRVEVSSDEEEPGFKFSAILMVPLCLLVLPLRGNG